MRAVIIHSFGGPEVLKVVEVPVPAPSTGQVRIKIAAAAVNPVDVQTRSGFLTENGILPPRPDIGIGWDLSGTIDAVGPGVSGFVPGDRVIGLSDRLALPLKAQAEFAVLDANAIGRIPADMDLTAAATLPLNSLTAAQALELAALQPGQTLLVTGAAGAVGGYTVELAARAGIRVLAVANERDERLVHELGAEYFFPRTRDLAAAVRDAVPGGVDAAVDAANIGILALDGVRGGGAFVAVLGNAPPPLRGIRVSNVWIRADGPRLTVLANAGLHLRVAGTLPLEHVAQAHERLEMGGLRGRLVLETTS